VIRTFDVEGTREGDAIATPASTVGGEILGLGSTRGTIREGKVVATANQTGLSGTGMLGGEGWILVA